MRTPADRRMPYDVVLSAAKRLGRRALASQAIYPLLRSRALRANPITVLTYHALGEDDDDFDAWTVVRRRDFVRQMAFLRQHYDVVSLDDAAARAGRPPTTGRPLAVVTFDDGHSSLHEHLLPIAEREALPVTVYVATGHIETRSPYWFDRVMNAVQTTHAASIDLSAHGLGTYVVGRNVGHSNWDAISLLLADLKRLPPSQRESAANLVVAHTAALPKRRFKPLNPLTVAQLTELAASPWITIGAHTHCHNLLDQISLSDAVASIDRSRQLLRQWTGRPVHHFAYPNGNANKALAEAVESMGFTTAFTADKGLWDAGMSPFAASRIAIGRYDSLERFKIELIGGLRRPFSAPAAPLAAPTAAPR